MSVSYCDIGHKEARAELWAWAVGQMELWRASTLYPCFGSKELAPDGSTLAGPTHYDALAGIAWYEGDGYVQGRVCHTTKQISVGGCGYRSRYMKSVVKKLLKLWPDYRIIRDYVDITDEVL